MDRCPCVFDGGSWDGGCDGSGLKVKLAASTADITEFPSGGSIEPCLFVSRGRAPCGMCRRRSCAPDHSLLWDGASGASRVTNVAGSLASRATASPKDRSLAWVRRSRRRFQGPARQRHGIAAGSGLASHRQRSRGAAHCRRAPAERFTQSRFYTAAAEQGGVRGGRTRERVLR